MDTTVQTTTSEADIRSLIDSYASALRAVDIDRIMSHYAPDVVAFDAIGQLQFKGVDAYRKHWEACLAMMKGASMIFDIHDVNITAGDDLAFHHHLVRCGMTTESGEEKASWMRVTAGYRKIGGAWKIVHEHISTPFDPESHKAIFDLQP